MKKDSDTALPIQPLFDNVLIEPVEAGEKTFAGGRLTLPDTNNADKPLMGIVRGVGDGVSYDKGVKYVTPSPVAIGQKVLYRKWSMSEVEYEGKKLILVKPIDLAAILNF